MGAHGKLSGQNIFWQQQLTYPFVSESLVGSSPECTIYVTLGKLGTFFCLSFTYIPSPPQGRCCSFSSSPLICIPLPELTTLSYNYLCFPLYF